MFSRWLPALLVLVCAGLARADGPRDNLSDQVRPVPPAGVAVPDTDRRELESGVAELGKRIAELNTALKAKPALLDLLPDVEVYHKSVQWPLVYHEFFNAREIPVAKALLRQGLERGQQLAEGKAPWETATGLVVRG